MCSIGFSSFSAMLMLDPIKGYVTFVDFLGSLIVLLIESRMFLIINCILYIINLSIFWHSSCLLHVDVVYNQLL